MTGTTEAPARPEWHPIVNINGSAQDDLVEQNVKGMETARAALMAAYKAAPHGRDFQCNPDGYAEARTRHIARVASLLEVTQEFEAIALSIVSQRR